MADHPTERQLDEALEDLVEWERFAVHLGIDMTTVEVIKREKRSTALQKLALYSKWLKMRSNPSWQDVIDALNKVDEHSLARNVERKYSQNPSRVSSSLLLSHGSPTQRRCRSTYEDRVIVQKGVIEELQKLLFACN